MVPATPARAPPRRKQTISRLLSLFSMVYDASRFLMFLRGVEIGYRWPTLVEVRPVGYTALAFLHAWGVRP